MRKVMSIKNIVRKRFASARLEATVEEMMAMVKKRNDRIIINTKRSMMW